MVRIKEQENLSQFIPMTKPNGGHGSTLMMGYKYALENGANYIFQTDSDGQTVASEFEPFWKQRKQYDYLIGNRHNRKDGLSRIFVTKVLKIVLFLSFGLWIEDANTPFRLMSADSLKKCIPYIPDGYNLANVMLSVIQIKQRKDKVKFIPVSFRERQGGENSINMKRIIKIGKKAIAEFREFRKTINKA